MQQYQPGRRRPRAPASLLLVAAAALLGAASAHQEPPQQQHQHLRAGRALHDLSAPGVLADSRRGDSNVATGTTSDPPKRVWEDRQHVEAVTRQEWLQPWLFLYDGFLLANSIAEGFPNCQWHARQDWNASRQGLLDRHAMYLIQVIPPLDNETVWRVTGDYFPVMYFSYQLYDQANDQMTDTTWIDRKIVPGWGKNPFTEVIPPQEAGGYQIHFTRSGTHGLPNELAGPVDNLGLLILRLYKTIPSEPLPLDLAIVPPKIQQGRLSDYVGSFKEEWPACSAHGRPTSSFQETWYQVVADAANGENGRIERLSGPCPMPLGTRGMSIFDASSADASTQSALIARNNNSPYLFYCVDSEGLRRKGLSENNIVLRITGKLPTFPLGLFEGEPAESVANKAKYDVRYLSFVTVKPLPPFSQYEGIDGQAILDFYHRRHGGPNGTWDGTYSLVVSTDQSAPQRCRLFDHDRDVFFGFRQMEGEGATYPRLRERPFNPTIVYRQLVPDPDRRTALTALNACRPAGRCNDTALLEAAMGEYYPRVEYYVCHSDGRVETPPVEPFAGDEPNDRGHGMHKTRGGVVGSRLGGM